ncbi:hypothetical protein HZB00_03650 [Candidatus Woesearchaeota archaeon]|nr:hypothetical protein [Candidatus Woesearchaeota archaeon]
MVSQEKIIEQNLKIMLGTKKNEMGFCIAQEKTGSPEEFLILYFACDDAGTLLYFGNPPFPRYFSDYTEGYFSYYTRYNTAPFITDVSSGIIFPIPTTALAVLKESYRRYNSIIKKTFQPPKEDNLPSLSRQEIFENNLQRLLGDKPGDMEYLAESFGGNAGKIGGYASAGYNFYYTKQGQILYFTTGNLGSVPVRFRKYPAAVFHYQLSDPPEIVDVYPATGYKHILPEAKKILEETIEQYNSYMKQNSSRMLQDYKTKLQRDQWKDLFFNFLRGLQFWRWFK